MPIPPGIFQAFVILSVLAVGICQKDPEKTSAQGWDIRGGGGTVGFFGGVGDAPDP